MKKIIKDDAVSPVIGVMLTLSLTIVLAAIFAANAGAIGTILVNDPVDAELTYVGETDDGNYIFEMRSGDGFSLSDLKIVYGSTGDETAVHSLESGGIKKLSGDFINVGDRFMIAKPSFTLNDGDRVTFEFYDIESGLPISNGDILVGYGGSTVKPRQQPEPPIVPNEVNDINDINNIINVKINEDKKGYLKKYFDCYFNKSVITKEGEPKQKAVEHYLSTYKDLKGNKYDDNYYNGYDAGYRDGYNGQDSRIDQMSKKFKEGYNSGYEDGQHDYPNGYYAIGYKAGFTQRYYNGKISGIDNNSVENAAYKEGYDKGYKNSDDKFRNNTIKEGGKYCARTDIDGLALARAWS